MQTNPPIAVAQARADAVRMVAAQARLYADVKKAQWLRLGVMAAAGIVISLVSLASGSAGSVGWICGVLLVFINSLLMYRQRRRVALAVSVQVNRTGFRSA